MTETKRTAAEIRAYCEAATRDAEATTNHMMRVAYYANLGAYASHDLPRVLEAAVRLRAALLLTRGSAYDMGRDACGRTADEALAETVWLADSPEAGGDADGDMHAISGADMVALGFDKANWRNVGSEEWPVWVGRMWK